MNDSANLEADTIWQDDLLGRNKEARLIIDFLVRRCEERKEEGRSASYVLNLDARWGQGKTFFLSRLRQQIEQEGYTAAQINAWQSDFSDDPLIPVIATLNETFTVKAGKTQRAKNYLRIVQRHGAGIALRAGKHGLATFGKKYLGDQFNTELADLIGEDATDSASSATNEALDELLDKYAHSLIEDYTRSSDSISQFRAALEKLVASNKIQPPFFVLIDELDRCRPSYAVALLERIKHLFDVPGVVFVLATDTEQLAHAVRSIYGEGFDAKRYLLRFFDRTYTFAEPDRLRFIDKLFSTHAIPDELLSSPPDDNHRHFFKRLADSFGLSLRDIEQCFDFLRNFATLWPPRKPTIELLYLLPLIFASQQRDHALLRSLTEGSLDQHITINGKRVESFGIEFVGRNSLGQPTRGDRKSVV